MSDASPSPPEAVPRDEESLLGQVPRPDYYLHSDGILAVAGTSTIMTILGSCVSVCLWDPARRLGGMNHFLLPTGPGTEGRPGRFGDSATLLLIQRLEALGARRAALHAKVIGGARINGVTTKEGSFDLGMKNVNAALASLEREHIPVVGRDVGGARGRKVLFRTSDGTVWVRQIGGQADGPRG